jgi:hypothetical protein
VPILLESARTGNRKGLGLAPLGLHQHGSKEPRRDRHISGFEGRERGTRRLPDKLALNFCALPPASSYFLSRHWRPKHADQATERNAWRIANPWRAFDSRRLHL